MSRTWKSCTFALSLAAVACRTAAQPATGPAEPSVVRVKLLPAAERQTIRSFGASDAWSVQFVGRDWPLAKRNRIADLLFSLELKPDGSPVGIGLSNWRFNIGAGSAEQGQSSGITDEWRRAESFFSADGAYDWNKQAGQRWFLRAAQQRGVKEFVGFVNSPPVRFTRNGKAFSAGGSAANLAPERYADFAGYLRDVTLQLERSDGVRLSYISPVNEPQWDWTGGQEGSPWLNTEIGGLAAALSGALRGAGLDTRIVVPEAGKLNYLYEDADRSGRGNQAAAFFAASSPSYLGDLPNVARILAGHSYSTTSDGWILADVRSRLRSRLAALDPAVELWMSEYCVLENNPSIVGQGRDLGMTTALWVARVIHADLTIAEATSWQWWLAVSPYDYKDGLVYIDKDKTDGALYESKLLWTVGHFSRFVRPGMKRIGVERSDSAATAQPIQPLLISAYRDPATAQVVVVVINQGGEARMQLEAPPMSSYDAYLTSSANGDDLRYLGRREAARELVVPAQSLMTLVSA